jgi:hypothetical protein
MQNSPLMSNNITAITVDKNNKKWFGTWWTSSIGQANGWKNGICVLDDTDQNSLKWTNLLSSSNGYPVAIRSFSIYDDMIWVSHGGGVTLITDSLKIYNHYNETNPAITPPEPPTDGPVTQTVFKDDKYYFFGMYKVGLRQWSGSEFPRSTNTSSWHKPLAINSGNVFKIDSFEGDGFTQYWFAVSTGLYYLERRNGVETWYQMTSDVKRKRFSNDAWNEDTYYYADEERLYGSEPATPTTLFIDPFGRVWIGTANRGIAMYDIYEDKIYNYKTTNSPLSSNDITSFEYQHKTGVLYVGTSSGLESFEIGVSEKSNTKLGKIDIYPNPFMPAIHNNVTIKSSQYGSMPIGKNECRIFDITGQLIITLKENRFMEFSWNGKNEKGKNCGSGVYFYLIKTEIGESEKGKIVLVR